MTRLLQPASSSMTSLLQTLAVALFVAQAAQVAAQSTTLPAPSRTVYKCSVGGKVAYSDEPCVGAQRVNVEPTRGMNKSTGHEKAIEAAQAPDDLKRSLREIRTSSWDVMNSYVHAGLHPLRRHDTVQEHEMTTSLRMSNGLSAITCCLITVVGQRPARQRDINIVCLAHPECMPPRHVSF